MILYILTAFTVILIWAALEGITEYVKVRDYELRRQSVIDDHNEGR